MRPLRVKSISLMFLLLSLVLLHACQINTDPWIKQKKEAQFNFKPRQNIRNTLKQQVNSVDFKNKTKIRPIQITFNTSSLSDGLESTEPLAAKQISYLTSLLSDTALFFSGFIKVLPYPRNIKFAGQSKSCHNRNVSREDTQNGIANSDLHIYILKNNSMDSIASAGYCLMGDVIGYVRPTFGSMTFNTNKIFKVNISDPNIHQRHFQTIIHEIIHILGFSKFLYSYFLESDQIHFQDIRGIETTLLASPRVLEAARQYYNCSTLCGMQLENQGSTGDKDSHWETTILAEEIMTGQEIFESHELSIFTVKLLQDTGFYSEINENYASDIYWGKNKGCEFFNFACNSTQKFSEFHYDRDKRQCTFSNQGYGQMRTTQYLDDSCSITRMYTNTNCKDQNHAASKFTHILQETFSSQSQCFNSNIYNTETDEKIENYIESNIRCLQYQCLQKNQQINIIINTEEVKNYSIFCLKGEAGKMKPVNTSIIKERIIQCPNDYEQFCQKRHCPNSCSQNGFCLKGQCICRPGYAAPDCSLNCGFNQYAEFKLHNRKLGYVCVSNCSPGKYINPDNTCKKTCNDGYFKSSGKCQQCDFSCSKCIGKRSDQCTACLPMQKLKKGSCI